MTKVTRNEFANSVANEGGLEDAGLEAGVKTALKIIGHSLGKPGEIADKDGKATTISSSSRKPIPP